MIFIRLAVVLFVSSLLLPACQSASSDAESTQIDSLAPTQLAGRQLAQAYCGGCHLMPSPALLDKKTWQTGVLPQMALRLGQSSEQMAVLMRYDNPDELNRLIAANIYPEHPTMHPADWQKIVTYYTTNAPDKLPAQRPHLPVSPTLPLFTARQSAGAIDGLVTLVQYDSVRRQIWAGDARGNLYGLNSQLQPVDSLKLDSPVVALRSGRDGQLDLLTIGVLNPNDQQAGSWQRRLAGKPPVTIQHLQRPVQFTPADLNRDGREDLLICQFGNHLGKLTWYEQQQTGNYQEHVLDQVPGARTAIVRDIDNDNWPDVVALLSQGDEQVAVYRNLRNGFFQKETLLRFPPVYGSSFLELADIDRDGDPDLIYTNGDNADYSIILKPYHGIRILLNNGSFQFKQAVFYPMYGVTQTVTRDFDQDGDQDIAAIAQFPDFAQQPNQSFVYFENTGGLTFKPRTFPMASRGRWLRISAGDIDQDGDDDILLGSFFRPVNASYEKLMNDWRKPGAGIMVLENRVKTPE